MSWLESLTHEELNKIEELKRLTSDDCTPWMLEDETLFYRFLKARDFNLRNAEIMLRKTIAWRKDYKADTLLEDFKVPEVLQKYSPHSYLGYDKDGDVIGYVDGGRTDFKGVTNSVKMADLVRFCIYNVEKVSLILKERRKKHEKTTNKIVFILNFDEFTFSKATNKKVIETSLTALKIYQDNYPELTKRVFIINCSFYVKVFHTVLKPFLSQGLEEKMQFFGAEGYSEALLEVIEPEVLPAFLGGSRTDPDGDPKCKQSVTWSSQVPETFYFRNSTLRLSTNPGVNEITVARFSKSAVRFHVSLPDSHFEWEFETKRRDIGFGVLFQEHPDSEPEELVPNQRIDTYMAPELGVYKCDRVGTYIIVFDNSYSWIHQKEIFYRARVIGPNEEQGLPWT